MRPAIQTRCLFDTSAALSNLVDGKVKGNKMSAMDKLISAIRKSIDRGDVTITELATAAGCSRQHIYGILGGGHQLSLPLAEKLAKAVGFELVCRPHRKKVSA